MTPVSEEQRWALVGEAVMMACRRPRRRAGVASLRHLPFVPGVLVAARWQSSPVGRFDEVTVLEPVLHGLRPALAITAHGVSVPSAAGVYRAEWGLPADPATIRWSTTTDGCTVEWEEEELRVEVVGRRLGLPLVLPIPLVQGGRPPFLVPQRVRGIGRMARAHVTPAAGGTSLGWLGGTHRGLLFRSARMAMLPRRVSPTAALQHLRLPLPTTVGPEPVARAASGGRTATVARSGALSSVG